MRSTINKPAQHLLHPHPETQKILEKEPQSLDFIIQPKHFDPNQPPQLSPFAGNERKVVHEQVQNDVHPDRIPFHLK
jgi:hypothetical protein